MRQRKPERKKGDRRMERRKEGMVPGNSDGTKDRWMEQRMGGWADGWMGGWVDGWMGGWVDGWMGGWVDGWMGGWVDGWMERLRTQRLLEVNLRIEVAQHTGTDCVILFHWGVAQYLLCLLFVMFLEIAFSSLFRGPIAFFYAHRGILNSFICLARDIVKGVATT